MWVAGRVVVERFGILGFFLSEFLFLGIIDYMIEQFGSFFKEIQVLKQVQEFLKDGDDVIIIGVFKVESDLVYQQYQDVGKQWFFGLEKMYAFWLFV